MSKNNIFLFFIKVSFMWTPKEPIKKSWKPMIYLTSGPKLK